MELETYESHLGGEQQDSRIMSVVPVKCFKCSSIFACFQVSVLCRDQFHDGYDGKDGSIFVLIWD